MASSRVPRTCAWICTPGSVESNVRCVHVRLMDGLRVGGWVDGGMGEWVGWCINVRGMDGVYIYRMNAEQKQSALADNQSDTKVSVTYSTIYKHI